MEPRTSWPVRRAGFYSRVSGDQFDAGKPEPDMFVRHAEHDFRADQVVHVGDNWEHDVLAPHQMGWKTAWIGTEQPPGQQATWVLKSVNELPEKLTQL